MTLRMILAGQIGAEDLIAILFSIEDKAGLVALVSRPERSCSKKYTELKRHVEAR